MSNENDVTVVPESNPGETFWQNEFTGKDINPTQLEFAKIVVSDYCSDEQKKELEQRLDADGAMLGSSRTLIKALAGVGDRLLIEKEERESSDGAKFYGNSMNSLEQERMRESDAQSMISAAIEKAKNEIIRKGRRSLPGRLS